MQTYQAHEFTAVNYDGLFTDAETETLALLAEGNDNASIAMIRGHGEPGAKKHVANVMHKLGCNTRTLAVARAFVRGYLISTEIAQGMTQSPRHLLAVLLILAGAILETASTGQDFYRLNGRNIRYSRSLRANQRTGVSRGLLAFLTLDSANTGSYAPEITLDELTGATA